MDFRLSGGLVNRLSFEALRPIILSIAAVAGLAPWYGADQSSPADQRAIP